MRLPWRSPFQLWVLLLVAAWIVPVSGSVGAESPDPSALVQARKAHELAREILRKSPDDTDAPWQFARACFDLAEVDAPNRARIAEEGVAACRTALKRKPDVVGTHYYLALNLGQLARTKKLGALRLVSEMEQVLKKAIELGPQFDYAGPHRTLGLLYRDAPGWPASIGSRPKAKGHLQKALELAPEYPDNHISLIESYLEWGEVKNARAAAEDAQSKMREARFKFTGDRWKESWQDWDRRWERIRRKTEVDLRSPRAQPQAVVPSSSSINTALESGL